MKLKCKYRFKRGFASDWKEISTDVWYSKELDVYYYNGMHYDERSARHNGLIGKGKLLKDLIGNL